MKMKVIILFIFTICVFYGCTEQIPNSPDGGGKLVLYAMWDSSSVPGTSQITPLKNASVIIVSQYGTMVKNTDINGLLELSNLPSSTYDISVRRSFPEDNTIILCGSIKSLVIESGKVVRDTIMTKPISSSGISINEIFSAASVNNFFYFYDQFIELYNSSDSIKYLDGNMILRMSGNSAGKGPGADEDDDNDIDGVMYVFKFPGYYGQKNYPIFPKQFVVLACDAVNHTKTISGSLDLSHADWEFYNQYSPLDVDNPNVPNLINMKTNETSDFLMGLTGDVLVFATGQDSVWSDGIDITTIIDGVEWQSSANLRKTLDTRIDRSYVLAPPIYSGKSIQRREAGFDTNDGLLDWEILQHPTPGYQ